MPQITDYGFTHNRTQIQMGNRTETLVNQFSDVRSQFPQASIPNDQIDEVYFEKLRTGTMRSRTMTLAVREGEGDTYLGIGTFDAAAWTCTNGILQGIDDSDSNKVKMYMGTATQYWSFDGTNVSMSGTFTAGSLHIPDQNTTANSMHVDTNGDTWWGTTNTLWTADNNNATAYILSTGVARFASVTLTSNVAISGIANSTATDISLLEYTHDLVFSATDADTVAWAAGTITMSNGRTFTISGGNTGNMVARTFVFLDTAVSSTVLQTTTTASSAMGANRILIAVAQNGSGQPTWQVYGGVGGLKIGSSGVNIANNNWNFSGTWSVTDADTVAWGAGTLTTSDGSSYSITGSNTGNMVAKTYIYFDLSVSSTAFQTTTTASSAVGDGRILIAIAQNGTGEATYMVMNDKQTNLDAANIVAGSITANEIATGTITADRMNVSQLSAIAANLGTITAGSITAGTATIGGFSIGVSTIAATNLTFTSGVANTAHIAVGTGADLAGMNSGNAGSDIAFWAGDTHANRATAPFRVDLDGNVVATSITSANVTTTFQLGGTTLTSTAAEINQVTDGVSANVTAANLNTLTAGTSSNADSLHVHRYAKILDVSTAQTTIQNTTTETTIFSASLVGGTLGSAANGLVEIDIPVSQFNINSGDNLTIRLKYGATTVVTCTTVNAPSTVSTTTKGRIKCTLAGASSSEKGYVEFIVLQQTILNNSTITHAYAAQVGTATENSATTLTLVVTVQWSAASANSILTTEGALGYIINAPA